jgi:Ca2+-binding RTX toxin-like protein
VIYNTSTGVLYFDPDGSGSRSAVQIAILDGHPALAHSDVLIF